MRKARMTPIPEMSGSGFVTAPSWMNWLHSSVVNIADVVVIEGVVSPSGRQLLGSVFL